VGEDKSFVYYYYPLGNHNKQNYPVGEVSGSLLFFIILLLDSKLQNQQQPHYKRNFKQSTSKNLMRRLFLLTFLL